MAPPVDLETFQEACTRYGPGRLPGAECHDIGAGYAAASAAIVVTVLFVPSMVLVNALVDFGTPLGDAALFFAWTAVLASVVVVPVAFAVGVLVWRLLPSRIPHYGMALGLLGTVGTYLGALLTVYVLQVVAGIGSGVTMPSDLVESAVVAGVIGLFAVVYTGWLAVPIGCVSGTVYARVRGGSGT